MTDLEAARRLRQGTHAVFRSLHREHELIVAWAMVVELSPADLPHAHILTREPSIPKRAFTEACSSAGLGFASIEAVRRPPISIAKYCWKTILPEYGKPLVADEGDLASFLSLNGNRLINTRGDFWIDVDGTILDGSVEAIKAVRRLRRATIPARAGGRSVR